MLNVVGSVLIKNNKILLPKRSANLKKMPNMYEFPGGKIEKGETLKEGLKRELQEELSIDVDIEDIIEFPKNVLETENFILTVYIVKKWKGELTINHEINSEILEVDFDQLQNVEELLETDKQLIPSILAFLTLFNHNTNIWFFCIIFNAQTIFTVTHIFRCNIFSIFFLYLKIFIPASLFFYVIIWIMKMR